MASIEITENTVIRNLIRKGTNADRETITLASGELGFSTDSERVFIGNGTAQGGTAAGDYLVVGNKFLGEIGSFSDANALPGDIFKLGGSLYARNTDYSGSTSDATGYTLLGSSFSTGNGLELTSETLSVKIDSSGKLAFTSDGSLTLGTVALSDLTTIDANTLLGNFTTGSSVPQAVAVGGNSVMGRQSTSTLGSVTFDQILLGADGTGTATLKPTVSGLTITELAGVGDSPIVADASGTLSRPPAGGNTFTQWTYYDRPYQIFGATNASGSTSVGSLGSTISTDGTQIDINPWVPTSGLTMPAGVKAVIVYGTIDTTVQPTGGGVRALGPQNRKKKQGVTVFSTLGTTDTNYQMIFTAGAGEEDDGKYEMASGSGQIPVILNASGNFKIGSYGWQDHDYELSNTTWYIKLYLVGYCL